MKREDHEYSESCQRGEPERHGVPGAVPLPLVAKELQDLTHKAKHS